MRLVILCLGKSERPYNVGSDEAIALGELAHVIAQQVAPVLDVRLASAPDPLRPAARYVPAITRARDELDLQPRISLLDSIQKTMRWSKFNDQSQ